MPLPRFSAPTIPPPSSPRRDRSRRGPSRTLPWKTTRSICTIFISWSWRLTANPSRKTSKGIRMWLSFRSGDGTGPFHSVTVRLDFRGADVGDLLYECTLFTSSRLWHESVYPGSPQSVKRGMKLGLTTRGPQEEQTEAGLRGGTHRAIIAYCSNQTMGRDSCDTKLGEVDFDCWTLPLGNK